MDILQSESIYDMMHRKRFTGRLCNSDLLYMAENDMVEVEEMKKQLRFVVVEDEAIILRCLILYVENMGHTVVGYAMDGKDAVKVIEEKQPDMVLADLNLPGKDGLTVIREACLEKMITTVIITGHYSDHLMEKANIPCVYGYLMKPISEEQVQAAIQVAWNRREEKKSTEKALEDRKLIERAKGILMDEMGLKEKEAMARLQKMARDKNLKLGEAADRVLRARQALM